MKYILASLGFGVAGPLNSIPLLQPTLQRKRPYTLNPKDIIYIYIYVAHTFRVYLASFLCIQYKMPS